MDALIFQNKSRTSPTRKDGDGDDECYCMSYGGVESFSLGMPQWALSMEGTDSDKEVQGRLGLCGSSSPVNAYEGYIAPPLSSTDWAGNFFLNSFNPVSLHLQSDSFGGEKADTVPPPLGLTYYQPFDMLDRNTTYQPIYTEVADMMSILYVDSADTKCDRMDMNILESNANNGNSTSYNHAGFGTPSTLLPYGHDSTTQQGSPQLSLTDNQARARFNCGYCMQSFRRDPDRVRHENAIHIGNQGQSLLCPIPSCSRSQGRGYCRPDKVKEHLWKKHGNLGYTKRG